MNQSTHNATTLPRNGQGSLSSYDCWHLRRQQLGLEEPGIDTVTSDLAKTVSKHMVDATGRGESPFDGFEEWRGTVDATVADEIDAEMAPVDPYGDEPSIPQRDEWTIDELFDATFPEPRFIVDGLLVDEGLTVFAGKKKRRKSLCATQITAAVAAGEPIFDRKVVQGKVLYYCLEDGPGRLKRRLNLQGARRGLPIKLITKELYLDLDGIDKLREKIQQERPRLVVIDTLASAMSGQLDENKAGPMAALMNKLRRVAQEEFVGVLLIAHHGKGTRDSAGDDIRGSSAIPAAADLILGLYGDGGDYGTLKTEGRDVEPAELRLRFDKQTLCWKVVGDERELRRQEIESEIIDFLRQHGEASAKEIAQELGMTEQGIKKPHLDRMAGEGKLKKTPGKRHGANVSLYSLP